MNRNFTKWVLSQLVVIVMLVTAGSVFAAPGDQLLHNSNNTTTNYGNWGVSGGKYGQFTCTTCHNKSTNNIKRVVDVLSAPLGSWSSSKTVTTPVVFNNLTGFGTDLGGHATSTKVCEACHSKTKYHRYNTTGQTNLTHNNQSDCTQCHSHARGFAAECNSCHGYPPKVTTLGVDGLVNPATKALGASPASPGAHVKHDNSKMKCTTCHNAFRNTTGHQKSGKLEMGFAANNANWSQWAGSSWTGGSFDGSNALNTATGGTPASYSWQANGGTTFTTSATSTVTCNVYCHGNWAGSNGGANPSWIGGSNESNCGACHGASLGTTPTTGAHARHAGNGAGGLSLACDKCHGAHPDNSHVTGSVKWAFDGLSTQFKGSPRYKGSLSGETGNPATVLAFGQCSNLYCHSNVQNVNNGIGKPTSYASLTWDPALINCGSCHMGQGAGFSLISSGSHRAHVSRGYTYNCNSCHNGSGDQQPTHADGLIQVVIPTGGTYSQAGQAPGNGYGTCATTACHTTYGGTPTWGSGPLSGAANCQGCHGNEADAATRLSGVHNKHMNGTEGGKFKCKDCHVTVISNADNRTILDKTLHANSIVNYSGLMAGRNKTCNNIYCHSNGKGTFVSMTGSKVWAGAYDFKCNGCHGRSNAYGYPDNSTPNSHAKHAPTADQCYRCHRLTAAPAGNALVAGTVDHLDKTLDARLAKVSTLTNYSGYYNANKTCTATYCHGSGVTTIAWGSGTLNCNSCHTSKPTGLSAAHAFHILSTSTNYNYANGSANNTTAATSYNFSCAVCHGNTISLHADGPRASGSDATILFTYTSAGRGQTATNAWNTPRQGTSSNDSRGYAFMIGAAGTCNATYCHSNGKSTLGNGISATLTWTNTTTGNCTACHGNEASVGGNALSGAHNKHMTGTEGGKFACNACHAQTISNADNRTLADKSLHVNKMINYSGLMAGKNKTCNNIYCHSNGKGTFVSMTGSKVWAGAYDFKCNGCHGRSNAYGYPDNSTPNSHAKHAPTADQCYRCHRLTAAPAGNALVAGTVDHLDKTLDARLAKVSTLTNYSGYYSAGKTCSATYCHGSAVTTTAWGTAGSTNCNSCHTSKPTGLSAAHGFHILSTSTNYNYANAPANNTTAATSYNFDCAVCHGNTISLHADGPRASGSDATILFTYTSAGRGQTATTAWNTPRQGTSSNDSRGYAFMIGAAGTCNVTYCHSNGKSTLGNGISATLTWTNTTTGNCTACHGNEASVGGNALSGAHNKHFTSAMFGGATLMSCKDCHAQTITNIDNRTLTNKAKHVNKFIDYSGTYAGKNKNCSNIYCHSNGKGVPSNQTWVGTNGAGCAFCHGTSGLTSGNHNEHISSITPVGCKFCHSGTTTNDTAITGTKHIDGFVNISSAAPTVIFGGKNVTFKAVGTTCSNISCHSTKTTAPYPANPITWGVKTNCDACHPKANLSGAHKTHMGALDLTSASILYNMTANRTPAVADTVSNQHGFGCANCHPMTIASHLNNSIEVDLNRVGVAGVSTLRFLNHSTASYAMGTTKKCSNMYCHSNASRIEAESNVKSNTSLAWTDKFANYTGASAGANRKERCAQCHLNQPTTGAHDAHAVGNHTNNIYNGKSGKIPVSSRANTSHGNPNNSTTINCYVCHNGVVTSAANDKNTKCVVCHYLGNTYGAKLKGDASIANISLHVNGVRDIKFAPIYVVSKAQVRPKGNGANNSGFDFYSGVWKRNTYKNMSTLSFDTAKVRLDIQTVYTMSAPMSSSCSTVVCHNGKSPTWNMADWNDPNKCMDCHNQL